MQLPATPETLTQTRTTEEQKLRLKFDKRDVVDIPPVNFTTAETQVRPKTRSKSRQSTIENLEQVKTQRGREGDTPAAAPPPQISSSCFEVSRSVSFKIFL